MNTKILIIFVLLLSATGIIARQCYQCTTCPIPFDGNGAGVTKINVGDDEYCQKIGLLGTDAATRDRGGNNCIPIDKLNFCCKGDLCNGATTATLSVKLLVATASLFFAMRFFQ